MDRQNDTEMFSLRTSVLVVVHKCLLSRGIELPHVLRAIDDFLNDLPLDWSMDEVYNCTGSMRCVQYMTAHAVQDIIQPSHLAWMVNNVAALAVENGDFKMLKWIAESYTSDASMTKAAISAADVGRLEVLEWLHENHYDRVHWGGVEWHEALCRGHDPVVQWLRCHVNPHKEAAPQLILDAAKAGYLEAVQWFVEKFEQGASRALVGAQQGHQWEIVKWILINCDVVDPSVDMDAIAEDGDILFMQWVYGHGFGHPTSHALKAAACNGHIAVLEWLHEGPPHLELEPMLFDEAAQGGHLNVLKWLHAHKCTAAPIAIDCAAENGFLDVAQWLYDTTQKRCTPRALDAAARNGHLGVVKWLHNTGEHFYCPAAINRAAEYGHLEVVKWLHANRTEGCSTEAVDCACHHGHLDVVQWLHSNRSEGCGAWAMDLAASSGHLDVVKWLHEYLHATCTSWAMDSAARQGHLHVVKWLHFNRSEGCTSNAMSTAAANGHLDVVRWLHRNRSEGCRSAALSRAIAAGHLDVADFLRRERGLKCSLDSSVTLRSLPLEMVEWLLTICGDELEAGIKFQVARHDWHYNEWMSRQRMRLVRQDGSDIVWELSPRQ